MYCWQFAIDGKVIFGRTWLEFIEFYDIFSSYADKKNRIIVYVHSLAHEFQFIRQFFSWYKVFRSIQENLSTQLQNKESNLGAATF